VTALGIAVGAIAALVLARVRGSMVVGIDATDPLTLLLACAILSGAGLCASVMPARRATRMNPLAVLRGE